MVEDRMAIDKRAIIDRVNRRLKKKNKKLYRAKSPNIQNDFGSCFIVDLLEGRIAQRHVHLEDYAREIGALEPYEYIME